MLSKKKNNLIKNKVKVFKYGKFMFEYSDYQITPDNFVRYINNKEYYYDLGGNLLLFKKSLKFSLY